MIEALATLVSSFAIAIIAAIAIEKRINQLIDVAFRERCGSCQFKKSKIPESQNQGGNLDF